MFGDTTIRDVASCSRDLPKSAYSLFQVMTMMAGASKWSRSSSIRQSYAWIFFMILHLIASFPSSTCHALS